MDFVSKASHLRRHPILLAALGYAAITIAMSWPLVLHLTEAIVGGVGDNFYNVWEIEWFRKVVTRPIADPFYTQELNFPEGWYLASTELPLSMIAMALPLASLAGPLAAYNVVVLLSFLLSGLFTFLWVRKLTGQTLVSFAAGAIFAFSPYRWAHFNVGHMNLLGTQWFPLFFLGLSAVLSRKEGFWKGAFLCGLALGLIGLTSIYYLYMTLLVSLAYSAGHLLFERPWRAWLRPVGAGLLKSGLVALPILAIVAVPYIQVARQGNLPVRGRELSTLYSASPSDYLVPSTGHFLWGDTADSRWRSKGAEAALYLGFLSLALAGFAVAGLSKTSRWRNEIVAMLSASALAFLLSLGMYFTWLNGPVEIPGSIKEALDIEWWSQIPMPGYFLYDLLPFYSSMRVWMRFGVFVLLFTSVLAGLGLARLREAVSGRWRYALALLAMLLALFEIWPRPFTLMPVRVREVDRFLASYPEEGAFIQFPSEYLESQFLFYSTVIHGRPFVGSEFTSYHTPQYLRIRPILDGFPDRASVETLRKLGIRFAILDSSRYDHIEAVSGQAIALGMKPLGEFDGLLLMEVPLDRP